MVVVDNSATNLKILARLASSLGGATAVRVYADPAAALSACAEQRPELVVVAGEMLQLDAAIFITLVEPQAHELDRASTTAEVTQTLCYIDKDSFAESNITFVPAISISA